MDGAIDSGQNLHQHLVPLVSCAPLLAPYFFALSLSEFPPYTVPPAPLLEVLADWTCASPKTVIRPVREPTKMAGLVKLLAEGAGKLALICSILAPFMQISVSLLPPAELFTKLQTGVLHLLIATKEVASGEFPGFNALNETLLVGALTRLGANLNLQLALGLALDRLAQTYQVALGMRCFEGSKEKVRQKYFELALPKHELFEHIFQHS